MELSRATKIKIIITIKLILYIASSNTHDFDKKTIFNNILLLLLRLIDFI